MLHQIYQSIIMVLIKLLRVWTLLSIINEHISYRLFILLILECNAHNIFEECSVEQRMNKHGTTCEQTFDNVWQRVNKHGTTCAQTAKIYIKIVRIIKLSAVSVGCKINLGITWIRSHHRSYRALHEYIINSYMDMYFLICKLNFIVVLYY